MVPEEDSNSVIKLLFYKYFFAISLSWHPIRYPYKFWCSGSSPQSQNGCLNIADSLRPELLWQRIFQHTWNCLMSLRLAILPESSVRRPACFSPAR